MNKEGVILTDGDLHYTVAVMRSLGKKNIPITVAADNKDVSAIYSKHCTNFTIYPSPRTQVDRFIRTLSKYVQKNRFEALFPMGDLTLQPVLTHRNEFERYVKLPFSSYSLIEQIFNKFDTIKLAQKCGVPSPKTFCAENTGQLRCLSAKISYPAVIKSRFSWFWRNNKTTTRFSLRPKYAFSPEELAYKYLEMHEKSPFPMIQEYIPGCNYSVALLSNNSHVKAFCLIKVNRTIPTMGGNSTYRETVEPDSQMIDYASKLISELNWDGIAEIEFRLDDRDDTPKLMEINGRFWGSLQVAISAGIDFPYLMYKLVMEETVPTVNHYKVGVRNHWLSGDLRYLVEMLRGNYFAHRFMPRTKWQALKELIKSTKGCYDEIAWEDIRPFLMSLKRWRLFYKSVLMRDATVNI